MIPKIKIVKDELPQRITASNEAAYIPSSRTIWLAWQGKPIKFATNFIHEMGHHLLHVCGFQPQTHLRYDDWWQERLKYDRTSKTTQKTRG